MSPELEAAIRNRTVMEICEIADEMAAMIRRQAELIEEQQELIEPLTAEE